MWRCSWILVGIVLLSCNTVLGEASESEQLAELLALRPGSTVADVGAGDGEWSLEIADRVGRHGRVFATEVQSDELEEIRDRVEDSGYRNITVIEGGDRDSGLPSSCCDAILLRLVYHHFTHPEAMMKSLARSLAPEGRLVVIDIVPQTAWRDLEGVPERGGHGIRSDDLEAELRDLGWKQIERQEPWNGDEDRFAAVFVPARQQAARRP